MVFLPLLGAVIGALVGLAFFAGLWWTTQRLVESPRPGLLLVTSMLARFAVLTVCLFGLARLGASVLVGALVGIVAVRLVLTRAAAQGRPRAFMPGAASSNGRT